MKRAITLLLSLCLTSQVAFAAARDPFTAGREALKKGDAAAATEQFEKAVAQKPTAEGYYWLGVAYGQQAMKANILKQAMLARKTKDAFERAVQLDPKNVDARLALIDYYLIAPGVLGGSVEKAKEQAIALRSIDSLAGHRAHAKIHNKDKQYALSRAEMVAAVREQPASAVAHYYLGNAYYSEKNYTAAMHEYEMSAKLDPTYMRAQFRIGVTAATAGTALARGEETLKRYLAQPAGDDDPSHASAWYYLGQVYEKQGRKADAKRSYLAAQKLAPEAKEVAAAIKRVS
jgi:tetratricopeptide (TPR) repeat protein